jgi:hypothetical protein
MKTRLSPKNSKEYKNRKFPTKLKFNGENLLHFKNRCVCGAGYFGTQTKRLGFEFEALSMCAQPSANDNGPKMENVPTK